MTPLCFIDTETTSLRPDRKAWDIALIRRTDEGETTTHFYVEIDDIDLPGADPFALDVGRFWQRHPQALKVRAGMSPESVPVEGYGYDADPDSRPLGVEPGSVVTAWRAAQIVAAATHGAHLVGAVPSFDAEVLAALLRDNYLTPAWHHHLIDVETLTVGYLAGFHERKPDVVEAVAPPWRSDDLSSLIGVAPPDGDARHTAIGDALWARAMYDHIMGGNE